MAAPLVAAAAGMAAKYLAKRQGKQQIKKADKEAVKANRESGSLSDRVTGTRKAKDYKENGKDSTTKEISGEMRFREPRQRSEDEYITDYGRTPRMSDDMKKGGKVKHYRDGGIYTADMGQPPQDIDGGSAPPKAPAKPKAPPKPKAPAKPKKPAEQKSYAKGGSIDGCAVRGKTKCKIY
jgi:hypothetical protein